MKAMILAAGYGTRLRPLTYTLPKPMVPLCNQPLIRWAAESLFDAGIRDLIINLHHLPEQIQRYLPEVLPKAHFEFSYEAEILGTGGGIRNVQSLLEKDVDFFLVNGDTVQFPKYGELRAARQRLDALAALTLRHPPEGDHFTPVWFEGGKITGFGEGRGTPLMFSGSHVISSRVFAYLPPTDFSSIVDEVYRPMVESGREDLAGTVNDDVWFDIGTPQRYVSASRSLLQLMVHGKVAPRNNSTIVNGSLLHESARGTVTSSVVGAGSVVEGSVTDSVIWDGCRIAPGVALTSCVVAHDVEISEPMDISHSMICRDDRSIPRKPEYRFENGLVIVSI
jgi:mannose-1-phosphate guanylyltransferase